MLSPKTRKYLKWFTITLRVVVILVVGILIAASYYLKNLGVSYTSFDFEFPNEITVVGLRYDTEDVLLTSEYTKVSIRLKKLLKGEVSGRSFEAKNMWIKLRPGDPNDTSTFEMSDVIPIQVDRVFGTNIHYQDKEGLDSTIVDLPTLFATNFVLDDGIFTDSITSQNGTLIISFPETNEPEDTIAAMADLIHLNANTLVLENAHIQINYPDESYDAKKVNVSLNGFGTDNPIDFKLNNMALLYNDSIELSTNGKELSITKAGDLDLQEFGFETPLFNLKVHKAGATAQDRYYATINNSHINSNMARMFIDDFPVKENTEMVFDGGIAYQNDSVIFNHFKVDLDQNTKAILNGYAIYGEALEKTNIEVTNFKSTLYELQRLFILDEIEGQKDVDIAAHLLITGNLDKLNIKGLTELNQNHIELSAQYAERKNGVTKLVANVKSRNLNAHQIVTVAPEDLAFNNVEFRSITVVDSSFNILQLAANFNCSQLAYGDYKLTHFKSDASIKWGKTKLNAKANEQNFAINIESNDDVFTADSIHFTGLLDVDIPTLEDFTQTAGNARAPLDGYFKSTDEVLAFGLELDSLLFTSDSLEKDYVDLYSFQYISDTTYGISIDLNVNNEDVIWFQGDPQTFDWLSADVIDTSNYPFFESETHLVLDSALFLVLVGEKGSVNISDLKVATTENSVEFSLESPLLVYADYKIENTHANFSTNFSQYHGNLAIDSVKNPYVEVNDLRFKVSSSSTEKIESELFVVLTDFSESIDFGIQILDLTDTKVLKFEENRPIVFGSQKWVVAENHGVTFDKDWRVQKSHFRARNDSQRVDITTNKEVIEVLISNFQIGPLYNVLTGDSVLKGVVNSKSEYYVNQDELSWTGSIDSIIVDTISVGRFTTDGVFTTKSLTAHQEFKHEKSDLVIDFNWKENSPFQYELDLQNFDLTSLNPLYAQWGFEGEVDGAIDGKLEGEINEYITAGGYVHFNDVKAQLDEYGMYLAIPDSKVRIEKEELIFSDFIIKDRNNDPLTLTGNVPLTNGKPIKLNAESKQFRLLEQENKNAQYWGKVDVATNLNISGRYGDLTIKGFMNTLNSSNIGYRYHSEVSVNNMDEEIEFTSFTDTLTQEKPRIKRNNEAHINWDVDVNMGKTKLYILISEGSNDYVRMTADGKLTLKSGTFQMPKIYGKLESNSGSIFYDAPMVSDLNLKIKRASIRFVGDAENPIISFKGSEVFRVSTKEIQGQSHSKGTMVPVEVIAMVKESPLDEFELKFDLHSDNGEMGSFIEGLPANTRETYAMNLLIFGTMTQSDQTGNSSMKAVVSKLNEISRRNIKSADLAFYIDTEEEVNVNNLEGVNSIGYDFSKEFFDDKVKVTVGGEVVLETYAEDGRKQFNPLGNVEIDYRLKEDPDITLFASKRDSYLGPIDGQVDKYSVGISFTRWFKNLFHKSKAKKEDE